MEFDNETKQLSLQGYAPSKGAVFTKTEKRDLWLAEAITRTEVEDDDRQKVQAYFLE